MRLPIRLLTSALGRLERASRCARHSLVARTNRQAQTDRPNDPGEWGRLYAGSVQPVRQLASPVARVMERLSRRGDLLLEAGCGSASISAELATAGRSVQLADFSQPMLDRAIRLFESSGLARPPVTLADLTKPFPWADRSVDITWSSGVLEHWTDEELYPILSEMVRISRRRVVSLVPYAGSVFYRWGKWEAENSGAWPYGRELPRHSQRSVFEKAGLRNIAEDTIWADQSIEFMNFIDSELRRRALAWWKSVPDGDPLRHLQGYLLVTVGDVA